MTLRLVPVSFRVARCFIAEYHRHHIPPVGWKWGHGVANGDTLVGVLTVGRPVARALDDGSTVEVTRCCVIEGNRNASSLLYGAAWRAARALGYTRMITYTLATEPGTSLRAAGWRELYTTRDRPLGWNVPSRPRAVSAPTGPKTLWQA